MTGQGGKSKQAAPAADRRTASDGGREALGRRTLYSIQYVRGLAAMLVVFHHFLVQLGRHGSGQLNIVTDIGQAGVDIFFVLSGFIMYFITANRDPDIRQFFTNRVIRIVPVYWFYTALIAAIALLAPNLVRTAEFEMSHVLSSFLFIPDYHPRIEGAIWPILVQGWTLNYEMFFYLVFGLSLMLVRPVHRLVLVAALFAGLIALGMIYRGDMAIIVAFTDLILVEFLFGMAIGWIYLSGYRGPGWLGPVLILTGAGLLIMQAALPGTGTGTRALDWGVPGALIVLGVLLADRHRDFGFFRVPALIGDASYSIYLSHTFVLSALGVVWGRIGHASIGLDIAMFAGSMVLCVLVGLVSYRLIELGTQKWLKDRLRRSAT